MKKAILLILCLCLLAGSLFGCSNNDGVYIPTGDALAGENDPVTPNATAGSDAAQDLVLVYHPTESMNPYLCNDYTNRTLFSLIYQIGRASCRERVSLAV